MKKNNVKKSFKKVEAQLRTIFKGTDIFKYKDIYGKFK